MTDQCTGGRQREGTARADADEAVVGLDEVSGARDDERVLTVGDGQQGLEPAQHPVGAPVLGQLHRRPGQVAAMLFELRLEAREERERVGVGVSYTGTAPVTL